MVAPLHVTLCDLYYTIYTEKYAKRCTGVPKMDVSGCAVGLVLGQVKRFPDEYAFFVLFYGMMEENMHFVYAAKLVMALVRQNSPHQLQL
jgi:hypothetical protein